MQRQVTQPEKIQKWKCEFELGNLRLLAVVSRHSGRETTRGRYMAIGWRGIYDIRSGKRWSFTETIIFSPLRSLKNCSHNTSHAGVSVFDAMCNYLVNCEKRESLPRFFSSRSFSWQQVCRETGSLVQIEMRAFAGERRKVKTVTRFTRHFQSRL